MTKPEGFSTLIRTRWRGLVIGKIVRNTTTPIPKVLPGLLGRQSEPHLVLTCHLKWPPTRLVGSVEVRVWISEPSHPTSQPELPWEGWRDRGVQKKCVREVVPLSLRNVLSTPEVPRFHFRRSRGFPFRTLTGSHPNGRNPLYSLTGQVKLKVYLLWLIIIFSQSL